MQCSKCSLMPRCSAPCCPAVLPAARAAMLCSPRAFQGMRSTLQRPSANAASAGPPRLGRQRASVPPAGTHALRPRQQQCRGWWSGSKLQNTAWVCAGVSCKRCFAHTCNTPPRLLALLLFFACSLPLNTRPHHRHALSAQAWIPDCAGRASLIHASGRIIFTFKPDCWRPPCSPTHPAYSPATSR